MSVCDEGDVVTESDVAQAMLRVLMLEVLSRAKNAPYAVREQLRRRANQIGHNFTELLRQIERVEE